MVFGKKSGFELILDEGSPPKKYNVTRLTIIVGVSIVLVTVLVPYFDRWLWFYGCSQGPSKAGFDNLDTDNYPKWYNDNSTMQLAQSGIFYGPSQMTEYVDFTKAVFFSFYGRLGTKRIPLSFTKDQCVLLVAVQNKAVLKPEYSVTGQGMCMITTVGYKLYYTVSDVWGNGFNIKQTKLFYPEKFLEELFNNIGGPNVADYICDTVLRDNCQEVYKENGLDEKTCKEKYDALPPTDDYGYLDEKTKGCRILHSAFAAINKLHCPHMSFKPIPDYTGTVWCQQSGGVKAEDLFTESDLEEIKKYAIDSGFDPVTLSTTCLNTADTTATLSL